MINNNIFKYSILATIVAFSASGCISNIQTCTNKHTKAGFFCHQGYNFGPNRTEAYKSGVRDGCRTANGTFTKNYSFSSTSKEYVAGWRSGRATCKLILPENAQEGTMRTEYQQSIDEAIPQ